MLKELIKIANELDNRGLAKEADKLDEIVKKALAPLVVVCAVLMAGVIGCNDLPAGEGIDFELEDTGGYGCSNKIRVSGDAEMVEDTQTSVSYIWYCVHPNDPYNDKGEPADIILQFDKEGPMNKEEIAEAVRNGADAQEVFDEIAVYCLSDNPRVSSVSTGTC